MTPKTTRYRKKFQSMTLEQRKEMLRALTPKQLKAFYDTPDLFLFDKQIIPDGDWRYCILRCGRRFGKGVAGSAWLAKKIKAGHRHLALCGASYSDVWRYMVPALNSWFVKEERGVPSSKISGLVFPNGAVVYCFTSDREERGAGVSALWLDELGSWCQSLPEKVKERFNILDTACSEGQMPQTIVTSTPKPFPLMFEWQKKIDDNHPAYRMITGNMDDNPFLSEAYRQSEREKYGNSRFGRQEYYGELLGGAEGALWKYEWFDDIIKDSHPQLQKIVVAVDPAVTSHKKSDKTGIVVAGLGVDGNCYILADLSGTYSPQQWARVTANAYETYKADLIIAERNMGGDLVAANIRTAGINLPVKVIHASRGKILRAGPVASLYEVKKVFHVGDFKNLIDQCCSYTGDTKNGSPDVMDSMVYAVTELMLSQSFSRRDTTYVPHF